MQFHSSDEKLKKIVILCFIYIQSVKQVHLIIIRVEFPRQIYAFPHCYHFQNFWCRFLLWRYTNRNNDLTKNQPLGSQLACSLCSKLQRLWWEHAFEIHSDLHLLITVMIQLNYEVKKTYMYLLNYTTAIFKLTYIGRNYWKLLLLH